MKLTDIFLTSDLHFGHKKMLEHRKFDSIESHDENLITEWNRVVTKQHTIFVLGDFSFHHPNKTTEILHRLNGNKILIKGNHDHTRTLKRTTGWHSVLNYKCVSVDGKIIVLNHFPILSWERIHYGAYHFHGHTHGNLQYPLELRYARILDVGVDMIYKDSLCYKPIMLYDAIAWLDRLNCGPQSMGHHTVK